MRLVLSTVLTTYISFIIKREMRICQERGMDDDNGGGWWMVDGGWWMVEGEI